MQSETVTTKLSKKTKKTTTFVLYNCKDKCSTSYWSSEVQKTYPTSNLQDIFGGQMLK